MDFLYLPYRSIWLENSAPYQYAESGFLLTGYYTFPCMTTADHMERDWIVTSERAQPIIPTDTISKTTFFQSELVNVLPNDTKQIKYLK